MNKEEFIKKYGFEDLDSAVLVSEMANDLESLLQEDKWIPVEDENKLPKKICMCYVYIPNSNKVVYRVVSVYPHLEEFTLFPRGTTHFQYCKPPTEEK